MSELYNRINSGEFSGDLEKIEGESLSERNKRWRAKDTEDKNRFHDALKDEFGTRDNPKEERLWELAWSNGHSSGFSEVAMHYEEMAELIL